jgi:hypothetical protein
MDATVIGALRRFLPAFLATSPVLNHAQRRAIWAITHCRTPAMGGGRYVCDCGCGKERFIHHSCNHRSCPQCGMGDTARWVERELQKRVGAPYYMVTFTLPSQLRALFFSADAIRIYDLFFRAAAAALAGQLARSKYLAAEVSGFTAILHTWNQQMGFHPHLHCIVPGAGIARGGRIAMIKSGQFLVHYKALGRSFRWHFRRGLAALGVPEADPAVWKMEWGVDLRPFGDGSNAVRYLGRYVCRTVISDSRIVHADGERVTIRYKDRITKIVRTRTMTGVEFVERFLRHVLPPGMRAIRRYGYMHPAAKANRERILLHTGRPIYIGTAPPRPRTTPLCDVCGAPMRMVRRLLPAWISGRGPPTLLSLCA